MSGAKLFLVIRLGDMSSKANFEPIFLAVEPKELLSIMKGCIQRLNVRKITQEVLNSGRRFEKFYPLFLSKFKKRFLLSSIVEYNQAKLKQFVHLLFRQTLQKFYSLIGCKEIQTVVKIQAKTVAANQRIEFLFLLSDWLNFEKNRKIDHLFSQNCTNSI
jgi:hypothetical protein